MPHNNPSTSPNIFDIFIDSITDFLRHDPPKTKASPPQKTNQSHKPPAPAPVQESKPKAQKNDDFNFLEWLFNPVNPPNPSTHHTTHHLRTKPQPRSILKPVNQEPRSIKIVQFSDEPPSYPFDRVNLGKQSNQDLIATDHGNANQHEILGDQSNSDKNSKNIQELLVCLKTKSYKKYGAELEKLEQILNLSLSCTDSENIASQSILKDEEIIKFIELLTEIKQENPNKFDSVIRKSFQGLQHLQSYQNSDDKITTTPKNPDEILLDASKKIELRFHPDNIDLKIYQGLLNPEIEDSFFIEYFCISRVGDSYSGPNSKPMILQRAEEMLYDYTLNLTTIIQQQSISDGDTKQINSHIDSQYKRAIKVLNERMHFYGDTWQNTAKNHNYQSSQPSPSSSFTPKRINQKNDGKDREIVC